MTLVFFFAGNDINLLVEQCNSAMKSLEEWSRVNAMKVNESKTKAIIFRPKNKHIPQHQDIIINSRCIALVENFKCLGVTFSANMSWDNHVKHVLSKISQITGVIGRLRYILPTRIKRLLYHSLFQSHLNYCQLVWGNTTSTNIEHIHLLQKKYLRHTYNASYTASTSTFFSNSGVIPAHNLYRYRLSHVYKQEIHRNINNIRNLSQLQDRTPSYLTRHFEDWSVPMSRSSYGKQCLKYTIPTLLNYYNSVRFDLFTATYKDLRQMYLVSM